MNKKSFIRDTRAMTKGSRKLLTVGILAVALVVSVMFATGNLTIPNSNTTGGGGTPWSPQTTNPTTPPSSGSWSGQLYLSVADIVSGNRFTTSAVTVNQIGADANGVFNFIGTNKLSTTQSANPQAAGKIFSQGQAVIVVPTGTGNPTNGLDYYPDWYYMVLGEGNTVYRLDSASCFNWVGNGYTINVAAATPTDERVYQYEASNVKYWNIGDLKIHPRAQAADNDLSIRYGGTVLASVTDASTWVDTDAEITANATLTGHSDQTVTFQYTAGNANNGFGQHFFTIDSAGKIHEYGSVLIISTGMNIDAPDGWTAFRPLGLTTEYAYYKVLNGQFPQNGMTKSWSEDITFDEHATAGTAYKFSVWLMDCQELDGFATDGTSTSVPQGYGFIDSTTDYGVGAVVHTVGFTTSSGASATPQLMAYLTTAS